jgi:hypothetical protein
VLEAALVDTAFERLREGGAPNTSHRLSTELAFAIDLD